MHVMHGMNTCHNSSNSDIIAIDNNLNDRNHNKDKYVSNKIKFLI